MERCASIVCAFSLTPKLRPRCSRSQHTISLLWNVACDICMARRRHGSVQHQLHSLRCTEILVRYPTRTCCSIGADYARLVPSEMTCKPRIYSTFRCCQVTSQKIHLSALNSSVINHFLPHLLCLQILRVNRIIWCNKPENL